MYTQQLPLCDLPVFVALASRGHTILAYGHLEDFGQAIEWCGRALHVYSDADQVAIGRPGLVSWPGGGSVLSVVPFEGWKRGAGGWRHASESQLIQFFDRVNGEPTTLGVEATPKCCGAGALESTAARDDGTWEGSPTRLQVRVAASTAHGSHGRAPSEAPAARRRSFPRVG